MDIQETLHTIAQIAITLAGFSGVVVAFSASRSGWKTQETLSLTAMLRASFVAMFCSFIPILLWQTGIENYWRISAALIGLTQLINITYFMYQSRWVEANIAQKALSVIGLLLVLAEFLAAAGLIPGVQVVVLLALLWPLFVAVNNFTLLIRVSSENINK